MAAKPRRPAMMAPASQAPQPAAQPAPVPSPHNGQVQSAYQGSQISAAEFRPARDAQVTQTVGVNPDPPASRTASVPADQGMNYAGDSPTGYDPITLSSY